MKSNLVFFALIILFLFVFVQYASSVSYSSFTTSRTCNQTWGGDGCNSTTLDDAFDIVGGSECNGTKYCALGCSVNVEEVYLNASAVRPNEEINVTCQFYEPSASQTQYVYIFYHNNSNWTTIYSDTTTSGTTVNRSVIFSVNSTEGTHIVRCSISLLSEITNSCSSNNDHDSDDVNFTVVTPLEFNYWNITNYTTGGNITSGQTYNRSVVINISANWTKALNYSVIEINATGSYVNYTICSNSTNPCTGTWTNFTINLTNTTRYNQYNITVKAIHTNDSTGVWGFNNTVPELFFYLSAGNDPNITNFWFNYSTKKTNTTNLFTNFTIFANVSDDVGLDTVLANISYPDGLSTNVTMVGSTSTGWQTWNYTFGGSNLPLNITGNYTVRIYARDIGGQEKASGVDTSTENMTFYVNNTYTLNLTDWSSSNTSYNRGEGIRVYVWDVNEFSVEVLNWTVNLTRFDQNQTLEFNQSNATYTFQPNTTDPVGNYTLFANVSRNNNTGNGTWQFNISSTLNLNFSQPTVNTEYGANGIIDTPTVNLYNIRNQNLSYAVNVTLQCPNGNFNLSLSGQQYSNSSATCRASTIEGDSFQITANTSDVYNNTGEFGLDLTTSSGSGGTTVISGGSSTTTVTRNVTVIQNVTANVTDFNFTLSVSEIQIYRGEDATIVGALSNTGETNLTLSSSIFLNSTCCIISIDPLQFTLEIGGEEVPFTISIHVNTTTDPDTEHFADLTLNSGTLQKSKRIKIAVEENPIISSLFQMTGQIIDVEERIRQYAEVGLDVGSLEDLLDRIKGTKSDSSLAMEGDNILLLKEYDSFIQASLLQINNELSNLAFLKTIYENKWNITSVVTLSIISAYLVALIIVPYFRIEFEIRRMILEKASLRKSRVETEKSFFLRKIDEKTFRSIITGKQSKIYKLKSTIDLKKEIKHNLVRDRLNPLYMGKMVKQKIAKIRAKKKQVSKTSK